AITIQNPRNRGGSTGHVLAKRSVTFTEIRRLALYCSLAFDGIQTDAALTHVAKFGLLHQGVQYSVLTWDKAF
ncbi:hypothetical protein, partial [Pseudomonas sp. LP_4_YM]|uniref:hypothetical protein n=1 Tax=Pseudomonas sp. LP_4_YM TaxID=2485135 RepID=UPI001C49AAA0